MADYASIYELGEDIDGHFNGSSLTTALKYTATVTKGNPLTITGDNQTEDNVNVLKSAAPTDLTRYVAIHSGIIDDIKEALIQGRTKVEFGGTVTAGQALQVKADGTFEAQTSTNPTVGYALQSAADGDFGLIYFSGVKI